MRFVHNDRQRFAFQVSRLCCFPHLTRADGVRWAVYKGIAKLTKHRSVEINPLKPARSRLGSSNTRQRDVCWVTFHLLFRIGQQSLFEKMDQRRLSHTSRSDHQDGCSWPFGMRSFSWGANGFQDSIKGFEELWMLNEAVL